MTEGTTERFRSSMSLWTSRAIDALKDGKPGDVIAPEDMEAKVGRSCKCGDSGYANVLSAINHVTRNFGVVWKWQRAISAWKCLEPAEASAESTSLVGAARRRASRSLAVAATVDPGKLDEPTRRDHSLTVAQAGMIHLCGGGAFRKKLATSDIAAFKQPESKNVIALMTAK